MYLSIYASKFLVGWKWIPHKVFFQFLFGAKLDEVPALREEGPSLKVPLQFSRVVRYAIQSPYYETAPYCW